MRGLEGRFRVVAAATTVALVALLGFTGLVSAYDRALAPTPRAALAPAPPPVSGAAGLAYGPPALHYAVVPHQFGPSFPIAPTGTAPGHAGGFGGGYTPMKHCSWMPRLWKLSAN